MDDNNRGARSDSDRKGDSSSDTNGNKSVNSERSLNREKDPVRVLQLSQHFFGDDTLEDGSMLEPSTQEDTVPFLIPSTPSLERVGKKNQPHSSDSVTVLEETCPDFESRMDCFNSSKKDAARFSTGSCNESDLTQDLDDIEATQPMLPSSDAKKSFNNSDHSEEKKDEDDDDDWELKFSESQTQDILELNKNEPEDDSLAPTQSFNIKDSPEKEQKVSNHANEISVVESTEQMELSDHQSDDEIEPSQSCLSDYRGETITSFKLTSSLASQSSLESKKKPESTLEPEAAPSQLKETSTENDLDVTTISDKDASSILEKEISAVDRSGTVEAPADSVSEKPQPVVKDDSVDSSVSFETSDSKTQCTDSLNVSVANVSRNQAKDKSSEGTIDDKDVLVHKDIPTAQENMSLTEEKRDSTVIKDLPKPHDSLNDSTISIPDSAIVIQDSSNISKCIDKKDISLEDNNKGHKNVITAETDLIHQENQVENQKAVGGSINEQASGLQTEPEASSKLESQPVQLNSESIVKPLSHLEKTGSSSSAPSPETADVDIKSPTMLPPQPGYKTQRKSKPQKRKGYQDSFVEKPVKGTNFGSFKDAASLEALFKPLGIPLSREKLETFSKSSEAIRLRYSTSILIVDQKVIFEEWKVESPDQHRLCIGTSPTSSGNTTSSTMSMKSLHSGEMADIDTSSSTKSQGNQTESGAFLASLEETFPITSTQKTPACTKFSEAFGVKSEMVKDVEVQLSPIATKPSPSNKRKRGKKDPIVPSSETSSDPEPKTKRKKGGKAKPAAQRLPESEDSKEAFVEAKSKKAPPKRKKETVAAVVVPEPVKEEESKMAAGSVEASTDIDSMDDEESNFGTILPGVKVMARWKDGFYYSGMVKSQVSNEKWSVEFEDGVCRQLSLECLIRVSILPKGTVVNALSPDDYYDTGKVSGHFREGNKVGYEVEFENGVTRRYPRSSVILSTSQAKAFCGNRQTRRTGDLDLDNVIQGKRKSVTSPSPLVVPPKKSPRVSRSKKPDSNLDSTASDSRPASPSPVPAQALSASEASAAETAKRPATKKRKGKKAAKSAKSKAAAAAKEADEASTSNAAAVKVLPQRTKTMFKDYAFLLTNADRKIIPRSSVSDSENSKAEEEDIVPFDKEELCAHIFSGGGTVLDKFDDIKKCPKKYVYLLANSYLRTMKYIQCIAAGISCIKHHWVQNCLFKGEILSVNNYVLPAGYSLITEQIVEWHGKTGVFQGIKIALVSANESPFVYTWAPVLLAAKADFVQKWTLPSSVSGCSPFVDILVTNNHCPPDIISSAKKRKIPIVSSEWIIQCLIMGKKLPNDAHPKFRYDFTEI